MRLSLDTSRDRIMPIRLGMRQSMKLLAINGQIFRRTGSGWLFSATANTVGMEMEIPWLCHFYGEFSIR